MDRLGSWEIHCVPQDMLTCQYLICWCRFCIFVATSIKLLVNGGPSMSMVELLAIMCWMSWDMTTQIAVLQPVCWLWGMRFQSILESVVTVNDFSPKTLCFYDENVFFYRWNKCLLIHKFPSFYIQCVLPKSNSCFLIPLCSTKDFNISLCLPTRFHVLETTCWFSMCHSGLFKWIS